jgi:hypothetical protein
MQTIEKSNLTSIGNDPTFNGILQKLTLNYELNDSEKTYILSAAILFLKQFNKDKRFTSYADFAYSIILKYSLLYNDFTPLFDYSINFGFYPISKHLLKHNLVTSNIIDNFFNNIQLNKFSKDDNYIETLEQHVESRNFLTDEANEKSYLAPTSFGKSSLIVDYIQNQKSASKIVIVVPTKSLLMQTYRMIRNANLSRKIIIHDEMYTGESNFIAIFTQERSLRLLTRKEIFFNVIFIDEAHNILKNDSRSILLSRLISKNRSLNPNQRIIYLSPLIRDIGNVKIENDQNIASHVINFTVKEPEIFEHRLNKEVFRYNRFVNKFYPLELKMDKFEYLLQNSGDKNFLYNYRPIKIEQLAEHLSTKIPMLKPSLSLLEIMRVLRNEVHNDFLAIKYLRHGIIYLHGKLPDLIKEYLEYKYKTVKELKYILANSVILEGMNLPIDTLFIFNTHSLQAKELTNLIGRVNRLNTIFTENHKDLQKLQPKIHFINSQKYNRKNSKMTNKILLLRSRIFDDKVENPILDSFDIEKNLTGKKNKEKYIKDIISTQENEEYIYSTPNNEIGKIKIYLIENGFNDFYSDINAFVELFITKMHSIIKKKEEFWQSLPMLEKIAYLYIDTSIEISDFEIKRLNNKEARNYYENHIMIGRKKSLKENINSQFRYFKKKAQSSNAKLYFGGAYGEIPRESQEYPKFNNKVYVDLSQKRDPELINLAIVKLKMEDDFISFKLNKFIVMLFDFKLISTDDYNLYIYGTTNKNKIDLTKYGLSINLISRLESDNQLKNIYFDANNNLSGNSEFKIFIDDVDDFYKFEINRYLS